ncbi:putative beta lactamase-like protein [Phytophthora cinnamomi]|uniref:putative beta lactamase-like protein n=1 Tax=Phytophthora cinnamomi TaxID=4785 RepID=UPI003559FE17|nr:putative beta lactamase-like protein [Phytophthora cinnamomi]
MDAEQLPLVHRDGSGSGAAAGSDSLQQQLSSYHERQRARQKRRHRSKTVGRATVGFLAASLLALLLVALSWPAQRNERALELRTLLDAYEHARNFSGVVRLSHNGQKKLQQAMGLANVPFAQPMREHSVFPMGAHVQLLTAVAMYQLQEKRVVALERPVGEYLTVKDWKEFGVLKNQTVWCPKVGKAGGCEQVTFQHLLYMGSGIQSRETKRAQTLETMGSFGRQVGEFIDAPLAFKPGTSYKFADENYVLLAYMVEKLSGLPFGEYLEKHVFNVLGLKLTTFDPFAGALGARHGLVDQYVQFYAHRKPNVSDSESSSASDSSSGPSQIAEKHLHRMGTGSCAIYQGLSNSLHGLQSTGKDMHKIYTDLFHEHGHQSKLLQPKSIEQILNTRNPAFPAFGQGIGVDFEETQPGVTSTWPAKIAFCGSTACTTTCMAMQMPAANMSIVASAFSNDVRLYFPSLDAFHAYKPRDFLEKRDAAAEKNAFEKNDGEVNTLAWSLLQLFLRYYAAPDN